jgi:outer membrane protein assembly factor BamA
MLEAYARVALAPRLYAIAGSTLTLNLLDVPANTLLAQQMQFGSPEVRSLLGNANNHGVVILQESIGYDSRDDEIVPRRGTWDQIDLRVSPSLGSWVPYSFGEIIGTARFYEPIGSRVVVAARALVDLLFGTPPFYQLTEYDDTYAIGGTAGIRGVPAQRYYGKIKLIGNLEARVDAAHFHFAGKPWQVAVVGFFDAGRLWADWTSQPQLDGTGLGIKWGTGVGVRVQQGQAFVVRGDIAWSPDAQPLAGYFAVGETF